MYVMMTFIGISLIAGMTFGFACYLNYKENIREEIEKTSRESINLAKEQVKLEQTREEYKVMSLKSEHFDKHKTRL